MTNTRLEACARRGAASRTSDGDVSLVSALPSTEVLGTFVERRSGHGRMQNANDIFVLGDRPQSGGNADRRADLGRQQR